jgi:hypothetical protein
MMATHKINLSVSVRPYHGPFSFPFSLCVYVCVSLSHRKIRNRRFWTALNVHKWTWERKNRNGNYKQTETMGEDGVPKTLGK